VSLDGRTDGGSATPDLATVTPDLATVAARFGAALHADGVPVGPERCERFARAVALTNPVATRQLYWCALATLVSDAAHVPALDRLFQLVFQGAADPAAGRGQQPTAPEPGPPPVPGRRPQGGTSHTGAGTPPTADRSAPGDQPPRQTPHAGLAAAGERLGSRDFADLTPHELSELASAMQQLRLAVPLRRSRRYQTGRRGHAVDLRSTLRHAGRTAGHPVRLRRRRLRRRPRRLVVLCDISGSMAPYARALLQLLYCAAGGVDAEVFTFATRLTRLTRALAQVSPTVALARAGRAAPDWSGGTRIGESLKLFNDAYGARGMARGAVVVIVSDGWDTGEPAEVARQMARLARLAYRIVWANPRSASASFQPLAGGMAAAWPYCDAVVSAHNLAALDELLAAIGAAGPERMSGWMPTGGGR
jgi:uncharacterized protein